MSVDAQRFTPTRTELLATRRAVALAVQGRDVLVDKRTALVRALGERTDELVRRISAARGAATAARDRLDDAAAAVGPAALMSVSHAASGRLGVDVRASTVAGVVVVDVSAADVARAATDRGYATATSDPAVDAAATAYEAEVVELLELAALELTVRRLAAEIARTTRQVNALEHVLVPRLARCDRIAAALDEREREETARLRRARSRVRSRAAPSTAATTTDVTTATFPIPTTARRAP
jgi:V/A-type H+-transporting ATPase subunit D